MKTSSVLFAEADINGIPLPSMLEYENFSMYCGCNKQYEYYNSAFLKYRTAYLVSLQSVYKHKDNIEKWVFNDVEPNIIPEEPKMNIEKMVDAINNIKIDKIPQAMADILLEKTVKGKDGRFDRFIPSEDQDTLTDEAKPKLEEYIDDIERLDSEQVHQVNIMMEKISPLLTDKYDLMRDLENIENFVYRTKILKLYASLKDLERLIKKYCKPLIPFLRNMDFMYSDKEHKQIILPIDYNTGRIKIEKFFDSLDPFRLKKAKDLQKEYEIYFVKKTKVIDNAIDITRKKGISDDKNPFIKFKKSFVFDYHDTINTLY